MPSLLLSLLGAVALLTFGAPTTARAWGHKPAACRDDTPHTVRFVKVAPGVELEVLDWGGTGKGISCGTVVRLVEEVADFRGSEQQLVHAVGNGGAVCLQCRHHLPDQCNNSIVEGTGHWCLPGDMRRSYLLASPYEVSNVGPRRRFR
jgi:hypothetical protein